MKTELLAPAGDLDAAYSAFYFGADAIYLGLRRFSARAEATNFSPDELDEITAYAHANGKKVYITLNTLIQESELPALMETLAVCDRCRADALIVQDLGVARIVRQAFPNLTLHASTQMAVHSLAGALALKKMGFTRVVLARELSLPEIQKIQRDSGVEIEVFVHGALCYSYSGLCLFSSLTTGRSANRGRCVYSCRDLFRLNGRPSHPFSMKDLALERDVLKLPGLSLKIEGRKKTALYVGAVTDYYRRILDTGRADIGLSDNLKQIFARPWTKLHLNGKRKDITDPDFVGHRGLPVGTVDRVMTHTITFRPDRPIARYDGIQIDVAGQEKPFGFSAENLTVQGKKVFEAPAGQPLTLTLPPHHPFIQPGNTVYLASSTRVKGAYPFQKPRPGAYKNRYPIDVDIFITPDKITAVSADQTAERTGPFTPAEHPDKIAESVRQAFEKVGQTVWTLQDLHIHNPDDLFVPASVLNDLRRDLYARLTRPDPVHHLPQTPTLQVSDRPALWSVKTDDLTLVPALTDYDELVFLLSPQTTPADLARLPQEKTRLALPPILRPEEPWRTLVDACVRDGWTRWEIGNPAGWNLLPRGMDLTLDATVSLMNTQAVAMALENGCSRVAFSVEDTGDNIHALSRKTTQTTLILYQDIPLFLSANCVRENACRDCPRGRLEMDLTGPKGRYILVSENCQTTVMDTRAFALPPTARTLPAGAYRVDFCHRAYTPDQARRIWTAIRAGKPIPHTTTGNFNKSFS